MRLYRAWDKKAESYIEHGFDIRIDGDGYIYRRVWGETEWQRTCDIDIEFSTGLKDKHGEEGYTGDRVDIPRFDSTFVIKWDNFNAKFFLQSEQCNHLVDIRYLPEEGEIIGNIHSEPQNAPKKD